MVSSASFVVSGGVSTLEVADLTVDGNSATVTGRSLSWILDERELGTLGASAWLDQARVVRAVANPRHEPMSFSVTGRGPSL